MSDRKGSGLLVVWCEVPSPLEDEFNRWYNEEHLPERLTVPGILSAARYEAVSSGPKHLAIYELESSKVMESQDYLRLKNSPTEWSKKMSPDEIGTVNIRNEYDMLYPLKPTREITSSSMAPALQIGRMDIPTEIEMEWND